MCSWASSALIVIYGHWSNPFPSVPLEQITFVHEFNLTSSVLPPLRPLFLVLLATAWVRRTREEELYLPAVLVGLRVTRKIIALDLVTTIYSYAPAGILIATTPPLPVRSPHSACRQSHPRNSDTNFRTFSTRPKEYWTGRRRTGGPWALMINARHSLFFCSAIHLRSIQVLK